MATISIEVKCDSMEQAEGLTYGITTGDHSIGRKHGHWCWFCQCSVDDVLRIAREIEYELSDEETT